MSRVLVVGSAHLDVLARAKNRDDVMDRIGDVSIEVGGTACNIAISLAHAGASVRFLSAMNDSAYSKVIVEYLASFGIEPHIEYHGELPTGGFSAHVNTKGEMISAVSSMPVGEVDFQAEGVEAAMEGVAVVMLDCNLSPAALDRLTSTAQRRGIPVYVSAVSEEKCLRIANLTGRIKGAFLNCDEYHFFCKEVLGGLRAPAEAASTLGTMLIVTKGRQGSSLATPDGQVRHIPPAVIGRSGSRLGMGDALAAGLVLLHELQGMPIEEAVLRALRLVEWVGASEHCHPGHTGALESAIDKYHQDAGHDALTGVFNRRSIEHMLDEALARHQVAGRAVCLFMLDIDLFKSINDTYGHAAGDLVIINVARAIQSCLRDTDRLGRWGGEEFIVVLPDVAREDALRVAERIRATVQASVQSPRLVTVSIGCSEFEGGMRVEAGELVKRADRALYEAKHGGRNRVVFFHDRAMTAA